MENLKLTEQELRVYAELFAACDSENSGRVPGVRASELFLSSGLQNEILFQVRLVVVLCCHVSCDLVVFYSSFSCNKTEFGRDEKKINKIKKEE
jgi:hypothetical protein